MKFRIIEVASENSEHHKRMFVARAFKMEDIWHCSSSITERNTKEVSKRELLDRVLF